MASEYVEFGLLCHKKVANGEEAALCYCSRKGEEHGALVYKTVRIVTWWVFDQEKAGSPKALISGEVVCLGHATGHIIDYSIIEKADKVNYEDGSVGYQFTMSLTNVDEQTGCVFRCWLKGLSWDGAVDGEKAEVNGSTSTVAQFELLKKADGTLDLHTC